MSQSPQISQDAGGFEPLAARAQPAQPAVLTPGSFAIPRSSFWVSRPQPSPSISTRRAGSPSCQRRLGDCE